MPNGMHVAPNPGPPIGKAHDISMEKEQTLMRMITTEGAGEEVREGTYVTIHLTISQPSENGELYKVYDSKESAPDGLKFEHGRSLLSEAVERSRREAEGTQEGKRRRRWWPLPRC